MAGADQAAAACTAPAELRYCARCAAPLVTRELGGRPRRCCAGCGFVHFVEPRVGVGALIVEAARLLLVRRGVPPERGKWAIPAGYLDPGVDPRVQVAAEVREETGLEVRVGALVDVYHNPPEQRGADLFLMYRAVPVGGRLRAGDDAEAAAFFSLEDVPEIAFASSHAALAALRAGVAESA